ncbi:MAG TPA: GtrA family protein [Sphingobium sp.]|uniref:GtrA family protein n=1 Tax=Sphingobium sp. TaxID=1912891 RepID=UPI002ED187A1
MIARPMIVRASGALLSRTYNRYLLASVAALGFDTGLFLLLLRAGMMPVAASAAGYVFGLVVHWLISTRLVFDGAMASEGRDRAGRKMLFVLTGLLGLAITMAIVGASHWAGQDPRLAKVVAIIVSFQATYVARRLLVFRP